MKSMLSSIATIAVVLAMAVVGWIAYRAWTEHKREVQAGTNAAVVRSAAVAQTATAHDAVQLVQGEATGEAAVRAQTAESTKAIESAPGAEVPVQPDLYNVALREHCRRTSARSEAACVALRHPGS